MSPHTPGPWRVVEEDLRGGRHYSIAANAMPDGYVMDGIHEDDNGEANATLMAAAPDLLAALEYVMSAHGEQLDDAFDKAQRAIARAKGEAA